MGLTCVLTETNLCSIISEVGSTPAETRWMTAGQPGSFAAPSAPAPGKTGPSGAVPGPSRAVPGPPRAAPAPTGPTGPPGLPVRPPLPALLPPDRLSPG